MAGIVALIERLSNAGVPLFGLSNFSAEFWPDFRVNKPIFDCFQDILISGEEKLVKPDPAIYALALERFQKEAGQCLFIDDRPDNIAGAQALGIAGHVFETTATLELELQRLALL